MWPRAFAMAVVLSALSITLANQSPWSEPRRGSWVRARQPQANDLVLVNAERAAPQIVLPADACSIVQRAAQFLVDDVVRLTGVKPRLCPPATPTDGAVTITLRTAEPGTDDRWEAYDIVVDQSGIQITGSNPRGTAFGVYELSERLGIDPFYIWTGYRPRRTVPFVVKSITYHQPPPAVQFRGLFHDDEDILPRPKTNARNYARNVPRMIGAVPMEWYERFFETALRLRMNIVAPWTRTARRFEVQKTASDWGLYYTSHHYDTLLSDPWHFRHGDLAAKRGVRKEWDWYTNRDGLIRFWRGGVEENKSLNCIWPIGMRGMDDYGYKFPADWTEDQKLESFNEAFQIQADLVDELLPPDQPRYMHFTMYTEMLPLFLTGKLRVPENVIIVWPDDNDGYMRALPEELGNHRHGVYYHLAYYTRKLTKQTHQMIPADRIVDEFRQIIASGATTYCKNNVSELREYVVGTRLVNDICWYGQPAVASPDSADQYMAWWCREYFGAAAEQACVTAYEAYFDMMPTSELLGFGSTKIRGLLPSLRKKLSGEAYPPLRSETLPALRERLENHRQLEALLSTAREAIKDRQARVFFFENLELAAAIDRLPTESALRLLEAFEAESHDATLNAASRALAPLGELERLLHRANRWPFDTWYGPSWVRERNWKLWKPREELIKLLREFDQLQPTP